MQEKSKGIILFAFNTADVDYVAIAEQCARLVKRFLDLPVTLITDAPTKSEYFASVVIVDNKFANSRRGYQNKKEWRNGGRYQAYEYSPYDTTILIDSDYLMLDKSLLLLTDTVTDYNIFADNRFLTNKTTELMGSISLSYLWATAIIFNKTKKTKQLFDLVGKIQRNYEYYYKLYNVTPSNFRNDFAFAIADNIINGYANDPATKIPWKLTTVDSTVDKIVIDNHQIKVYTNTEATLLPQQNLHVMDKDFLTSNKLIKLVDSVCND